MRGARGGGGMPRQSHHRLARTRNFLLHSHSSPAVVAAAAAPAQPLSPQFRRLTRLSRQSTLPARLPSIPFAGAATSRLRFSHIATLALTLSHTHSHNRSESLALVLMHHGLGSGILVLYSCTTGLSINVSSRESGRRERESRRPGASHDPSRY